MWTRPSDRAASYGACGQGMDKCCALAHPLPTLAALAPTSSPLLQQRFMTKATAPTPTASQIAPSSQAVRLRYKPANSPGDSTRQSAKQQMGRQTQDRQGPTQPSAEGNWPMVPEPSALETARPAGGAEPQAERSLRLLRHHRQLPSVEPIPIRSGTAVAQMARPAELAGPHDMGPLRAPTQHLSPPRGASRAQCVPLSSETII